MPKGNEDQEASEKIQKAHSSAEKTLQAAESPTPGKSDIQRGWDDWRFMRGLTEDAARKALKGGPPVKVQAGGDEVRVVQAASPEGGQTPDEARLQHHAAAKEARTLSDAEYRRRSQGGLDLPVPTSPDAVGRGVPDPGYADWWRANLEFYQDEEGIQRRMPVGSYASTDDWGMIKSLPREWFTPEMQAEIARVAALDEAGEAKAKLREGESADIYGEFNPVELDSGGSKYYQGGTFVDQLPPHVEQHLASRPREPDGSATWEERDRRRWDLRDIDEKDK